MFNKCSISSNVIFTIYSKSPISWKIVLQELRGKMGFNDNIVLGIHVRQGDVVFSHRTLDTKRFKNPEEIENVFKCANTIENKIKEKYKTTKIIWFLASDSHNRKPT